MNRTLIYHITEKDSPCTVESFLKDQGYSRQIIIHLKKTEKGILVNGEWAYVKTLLQTGDTLKIQLIEWESSENIIPSKLPVSIVYEDEDILVLNKAADMPIHPSINNYDNTLANGVAYYYQQKKETFVFRCINRLDRDTTGLLIIAKHALSASVLSSQMKKREIRRTYLAVTDGIPSPLKGTINMPIARKEGSAIERCTDPVSGETAITHYEVLKKGDNTALVELHLETGRTHQIRVHMQYMGTPLLGDYLYHPRFDRIKRVALHSAKLEFTHPVTGEALVFEAPLPEDMRDIIKNIL